MDLQPLIPLLSFAAAAVLTINGIRLNKPMRQMVLGPVLVLSAFSLASSYMWSWPEGSASTFASLMAFYLPYSVKVLALDEHPVSPELSAYNWSFVDCYRIWNNPRGLPLRLSPLDRRRASSTQTRLWFAAHQLAKAAALWALQSFFIRQVIRQSFKHVTAKDFSPEMELPSGRQVFQMSARQIQVRAVMSVDWIWTAYYFLEFFHCLLAIVFVSVLKFDEPEDWPPLFGSLNKADSIRGFWGSFWHRLTIPTYAYYSKIIAAQLVVKPSSRSGKTLVAFLIFTLSGLSHSLVGWSSGDTALLRDMLFFELNFLAAAVETASSKSKALKLSLLPNYVRTLLGMVWVFTYFFCVAPMWLYPKVYYALLASRIS